SVPELRFMLQRHVRYTGSSGGDAILHAGAGGVPGAAGRGDIGDLFPDTDPANRGLDSRKILQRAVDEAKQAGFAVANVDIVIEAEEPKLADYKQRTRAALADGLGCAPDAVGLKAKTGEGLGPVGRGEAIACRAVVLLKRTGEK
ncbi:MAG: 2-C-methyl-D-erythritol 2,4-cyclodiphosphate synthase, partial [Planctomycetia bacterium]|nr:2-C-methyl-D-erythritol 2,4-cyclodiphosphate synthase [Planctomycetia bacterium]